MAIWLIAWKQMHATHWGSRASSKRPLGDTEEEISEHERDPKRQKFEASSSKLASFAMGSMAVEDMDMDVVATGEAEEQDSLFGSESESSSDAGEEPEAQGKNSVQSSCDPIDKFSSFSDPMESDPIEEDSPEQKDPKWKGKGRAL